MFARFQQSETRLTAVLADSRREGGRVVNEHIATLGSVPLPPSIADRIAFWAKANARLAKAGNRIGPDMAKIMGQLHARIPMVTPDEQRALQLENAKADERFWTGHREFSEGLMKSHKMIAATAERAAATAQAAAADGAAKAAAAKDRAERIERGEDVEGGLGKPLSYEDALQIARDAGLDIPHMHRIGEIVKLGGEEEYREEVARRRSHDIEKAASRAVLKRLQAMNAAIEIVNDTEHEEEWREVLGDERYEMLVDAFADDAAEEENQQAAVDAA